MGGWGGDGPRTRGRPAVWLATGVAVLSLVGCVPWPASPPPAAAPQSPRAANPSADSVPKVGNSPSLERARRVLPKPRAGQRWYSGVWAGGGTATGARAEAFGSWRGTPTGAATTFPAWRTWQELHDSSWHISTFGDFSGVLVYGLPMLPSNGSDELASVVTGQHDWVYRKIAKDLVANDHGRAIVRVGWEPNGDWYPWNSTADSAAVYVAAYRHIVGVLRSVAPNLVIDFDLACGTQLRGQGDRLDALRLLYPGDDVVDLVGCDTYDWYHTVTRDDASWERSKRPAGSVGIQDVADFARERGKGFSVPEWGLASPESGGLGDNPLFITKMREFFEQNRDILVLESYFSEPEASITNSIWDPAQNPRAAEEYRRLF